MDLFRNPKLAAAVFCQPEVPPGALRHRAGGIAGGGLRGHARRVPGGCWAFTNADAVRMYRDGDLIAVFTPDRQGRFAALAHPPIQIDDFVGPLLEKYEGIAHGEAVQLAACPERPAAGPRRPFASAAGPPVPSDARFADERGHPGPALPHLHRDAGRAPGAFRFEAVWRNGWSAPWCRSRCSGSGWNAPSATPSSPTAPPGTAPPSPCGPSTRMAACCPIAARRSSSRWRAPPPDRALHRPLRGAWPVRTLPPRGWPARHGALQDGGGPRHRGLRHHRRRGKTRFSAGFYGCFAVCSNFIIPSGIL